MGIGSIKNGGRGNFNGGVWVLPQTIFNREDFCIVYSDAFLHVADTVIWLVDQSGLYLLQQETAVTTQWIVGQN